MKNVGMDNCGMIMKIYNQFVGKKLVLLPLYSSQIPHRLIGIKLRPV
jgi:hypothetical protein